MCWAQWVPWPSALGTQSWPELAEGLGGQSLPWRAYWQMSLAYWQKYTE